MKQSNKKLQEYHDKHPYAASHPYAKGRKLKPEGAPHPYAKTKALKKKTGAKKYDVERGSATWRHKMREAYKKGGMDIPDKFK